MTLKELRLNKKKSQRSLAKELGIHYVTYGGWEIGTHSPTTENYERLVNYFGEAPDNITPKDVGKPIV